MTIERLNAIEQQIDEKSRQIKYDIREFTIEYYVNKYYENKDTDENEIFVPEYQREFVWDDKRQSRFIETIILGLPSPLLFLMETNEGRLEIVDGSQRIRTLNAFIRDELTIQGLVQLDKLNGLKFSDLSDARKRRIKNTSLRSIILSPATSEVNRKELYDRINTSAMPLFPMEIRRGVYPGPFMDFVSRLASMPEFKKLCREDYFMKNRHEEEELVLRLFAFSDMYPNFIVENISIKDNGVARFLDQYLNFKNNTCNQDELYAKEEEFKRLLKFIDVNFPNQGFSKAKNVSGVSKPYFEAIAIGALFALRIRPDLKPRDLEWSRIDKNNINDFYKMVVIRYRTHTPAKLTERIKYAKEHYLK